MWLKALGKALNITLSSEYFIIIWVQQAFVMLHLIVVLPVKQQRERGRENGREQKVVRESFGLRGEQCAFCFLF